MVDDTLQGEERKSTPTARSEPGPLPPFPRQLNLYDPKPSQARTFLHRFDSFLTCPFCAKSVKCLHAINLLVPPSFSQSVPPLTAVPLLLFILRKPLLLQPLVNPPSPSNFFPQIQQRPQSHLKACCHHTILPLILFSTYPFSISSSFTCPCSLSSLPSSSFSFSFPSQHPQRFFRDRGERRFKRG